MKAPVTPPAPSPPVRPAALAKGTPVRMLAGIHASRTGVVTWARDQGSKVTYAVTFDTELGKATTQVASTSFGTKWELVPTRLPAAPLAKGTAVRMIAGLYSGYSGHIAYVRAEAGSRSEATYMLSLAGPDGRRARTTVKHASLGRIWATM